MHLDAAAIVTEVCCIPKMHRMRRTSPAPRREDRPVLPALPSSIVSDHLDQAPDDSVVYDVPRRAEIVRSPSDALRFSVSFVIAAAGILAVVLVPPSANTSPP